MNIYESPDNGKTVYRRKHGSLDRELLFDSSNDEFPIDEVFMLACEEEASKLEITVDYYMAEFI